MKTAGIYIHIPFCAIKCMYCDFYSVADREDAIPKFVKSIIWEIENCSIDVSEWEFDTIFFGGGTPSLLEAKYLDSIFSSLSKKYDISNIKEFTIEANPGEAPKERLIDFYSIGINRVSIGVQTFQPELLKFLTRLHNRDQIFTTYDSVRSAGFENVNCDLIYSIPNQTWNMWEEDLKTLIKMNPEHISAYTLTVEKGTDLFSLVNNNEISMPGQNQEGDWFVKTHDLLSNNGYQAYEVSNFSKFGYECKHNLHYWNIEPYLAFGPSAHGFDGSNRWNNIRSINQYLDRINSGESPVSKNERLKLTDYLNELIGFGLRMREGIDISMIPKEHQDEFNDKITLTKKRYPGCFQNVNPIISLTKKGMLFSDKIIPELLF